MACRGTKIPDEMWEIQIFETEKQVIRLLCMTLFHHSTVDPCLIVHSLQKSHRRSHFTHQRRFPPPIQVIHAHCNRSVILATPLHWFKHPNDLTQPLRWVWNNLNHCIKTIVRLKETQYVTENCHFRTMPITRAIVAEPIERLALKD